jgi:hypothetical protein
MGKRKNSNKQVDRDKWVNDLMGHWGHLSDVANRSSVTEIEWKPDNNSLFLPIQRAFAKTVGLDLVEVKPMSAPMGILHYIDTEIVYTDEEQIDMDAEKWMRENIEWIKIKNN